jgi:hypothetical protein
LIAGIAGGAGFLVLVVVVGLIVFVCRARKADPSANNFQATPSKSTIGTDYSNALGVTMETVATTPSAQVSEYGPMEVQEPDYNDVSDVRSERRI